MFFAPIRRPSSSSSPGTGMEPDYTFFIGERADGFLTALAKFSRNLPFADSLSTLPFNGLVQSVRIS